MDKIDIAMNEHPPANPIGYTNAELRELIGNFPEIEEQYVYNALIGNTCGIEDGELLHYGLDVYRAIRCGVEKRNLRVSEWD